MVSGLQFTSTGSRLYSSSCDSNLAMYNVGSLKLLKLLGNTVIMGTVAAPGAICLDHDDNKLAVVGPLPHTITIMDADNLNEVSQYDSKMFINLLYEVLIHVLISRNLSL